METAVVSLIEEGDKVLSIETGHFGQRFSMMAEIHGGKLERIVADQGHHADYDKIDSLLKKSRYKAVLFTHVDTSTSVMNDPVQICNIAHNNGALAICDSVCGIGGAPLDFDSSKADVVLTGSQKALAAPPGAALLAVSNDAYKLIENRKSPIRSYYMNLLRWKPIMDDPKIYLTTPAVQVMLALREALEEVKREGIENRWKRHATLAKAFRAGLEVLNLKPMPDNESRAPTVTAFFVPKGSSTSIQETLREKYGIHIAVGFAEHKDYMLRVGHFGNMTATDVLALLAALELSISESSNVKLGAAVGTAMPLLQSLS
jgi:alanine-glyoxylate transaminase/serine-glyoxylate transaminase/serine-pyruvate transaminase